MATFVGKNQVDFRERKRFLAFLNHRPPKTSKNVFLICQFRPRWQTSGLREAFKGGVSNPAAGARRAIQEALLSHHMQDILPIGFLGDLDDFHGPGRLLIRTFLHWIREPS